jgi:CRP/FNR family transcriptional regulator, cyclic AMP receptor protein
MSSKSILNDEVILKRLKEVSFFQMYANNDDVISKIVQICTKKTFKKGSYLIKEGDYGDTLYIILSGEIEILKKTLQNEKYTVTSLYADMGGLSVGELALIDNDQRSATVYATTDCECLVITRNDFIEFGDENPEIGLNITRVIASQLSSKLRKSTSDVITLFSALVEEISEYE